MRRWRRRLLGFLAATLATALLATTASTLSVLLRLRAMDVELSLGEVLGAVTHDWLGMAPLYAALVAVGFLVALPVASGLTRLVPPARLLLHAFAGAAALATILLSMRAIFGITTIAGARSVSGLAVQLLAGAAGGWLFAHLTRENAREG